MINRRTKIVCTLGPAVDSKEKIQQLIDAGMNVARINCSHGTWDVRKKWIKWIRELSPEIAPVGILVDLQGPKFRIGEIKDGSREISIDEILTLGQGSKFDIDVPQDEIYNAIEINDKLLLGDGETELFVAKKIDNHFEVKVVTGDALKSNKGITIMGKSFDVPVLTQKDLQDIEVAGTLGIDFIALSYVRNSADIRELRVLIDRFQSSIQICAKIENKAALVNLDEIIKATDLVMVARGDMGLQLDIESVPVAQKIIISKCALAGCPVITATQMLESMINLPRPTRAEATDIANAILDGTDAVMLSGETASGKYPIEAVKIMSKISLQAEGLFDNTAYTKKLQHSHALKISSTEAVALAAVQLANSIDAKAIITTTSSGFTARMVSKFRPATPILCATWEPTVHHQMSIIWGVESIQIPKPKNTDEIIQHALNHFVELGHLKYGETVVITSGIPVGSPGSTNMVLVQEVKQYFI